LKDERMLGVFFDPFFLFTSSLCLKDDVFLFVIDGTKTKAVFAFRRVRNVFDVHLKEINGPADTFTIEFVINFGDEKEIVKEVDRMDLIA